MISNYLLAAIVIGSLGKTLQKSLSLISVNRTLQKFVVPRGPFSLDSWRGQGRADKNVDGLIGSSVETVNPGSGLTS